MVGGPGQQWKAAQPIAAARKQGEKGGAGDRNSPLEMKDQEQCLDWLCPHANEGLKEHLLIGL